MIGASQVVVVVLIAQSVHFLQPYWSALLRFSAQEFQIRILEG